MKQAVLTEVSAGEEQHGGNCAGHHAVRKNISEPNELLEQHYEIRLDARKAETAISDHPPASTLLALQLRF